MEKKFKILRIIGTVWKILAWIALVVGVLASIGMLLSSIFGGEMMRQLMPPEQMPWSPLAFGIVGGIVTFLVSLVVTIIYFLLFYAVGELIYLVLAIEENTRQTAQWIGAQFGAMVHPVPPPAYPTPPPPPPPPSYPTPPPPSSPQF